MCFSVMRAQRGAHFMALPIMNIEIWERIVRVVIGLALLSVIAFVEGRIRWVGLFGLIPLLTGLIGWCPIYAWIIRD
jgi:hypothetical protein